MQRDTGALDVRLLGQARFSVGGNPVKFAKRGVTVAMLGYLLLHGDRPVARDLLSFTMFPDFDEESALGEMRRYLHLALKALPPNDEPWIIADATTVRWNPNAQARIDVREFERLSESRETFADAAAEYGGDLLPEIYEDWVLVERERLRTRYLNVLSALVHDARSARDYKNAIGHARRLLTEDPWREDIVRHVLAARYEMGDGAGAIAEFDRFTRSLREELQAVPMPETRALRDAISAGMPIPSTIDRASVGLRQSSHGLPFAGRQQSLDRLHRSWERAARAHGGVVAIEGEPGVGKSRLAAELAMLVESEGGRVLAGMTGCPERVPYQCVTDVLRAALPLTAGISRDSLRKAVLAQVLPELHAEDPSMAQPPSIEPERDQIRLFDAIGSLLAALARTRPLLIILEDLHWAGRATLDLVRSLARRATSSAMLIVVTLRDDETPPDHPLRTLQRELASDRLAVRLPLARLTSADVGTLLAQLSDDRKANLDPDWLFACSEGNALFLSEAIHDALERGPSQRPPVGIVALIERRLSSLSDDAQRLARGAAVCGTTFDTEVACSVSGTRDAQALGAVDELLERQVIRESGLSGGFDYAFTHHLIVTTLYDSIEEEERSRRHGLAARALQRVYKERLDDEASEIARHYDAAGDGAQAGVWYARAASVSASMFAHEEALLFATRALERVDDPSARIALLLTCERANARLGRRAEQGRDLDRLDAESLDVDLRCEVLRRRIDVLRHAGDRDAELRAIEVLRDAAEQSGDLRWQGIAACARASLEISKGNFPAGMPFASRALELLAAGDINERIEALAALVEIHVAIGNTAEAERLLQQAIDAASQSGDERALVTALMQAVAVAMAQQQFERVLGYAGKVLRLLRSHGDRVGEARVMANIAAASFRLSHWEDARTANLKAAKTFESIGDRRGLGRVLMNLGMLHGRCGDFDVGRRFFASAREHHLFLEDDRARTASYLNESFMALWQQAPQQAEMLAREALDLATRMNHAGFRAASLANLGAAERDQGKLRDAIEHMEEGLAMQLELGRLPDAVSDLADAALAHAMNGDMERARAHVEKLLSLEESLSAGAIFPGFPLWVAARVLHAMGDGRAPGVLSRAQEMARTAASGVDNAELRASYEAIPFIAEMREADEGGVWPAFSLASVDEGSHAVRTAT